MSHHNSGKSFEELERLEALPKSVASLISPFVRFGHLPIAGGVLLVLSAVLAMVFANTGLSEWYFDFWGTSLGFTFDGVAYDKLHGHPLSLGLWVNDALMAIFFVLVGLEVKRELLHGELNTRKKAMLPLIAALGGMLVPGVIYLMFNSSGAAVRGWATPMATDIAFSLGILSLLGNRVPVALKVFLTAFAIFDDLGAVIIIATCYTAHLNLIALAIGIALLGLLTVLNLKGYHKLWPYLTIGAVIWYFFLISGVHATVAGVAVAMTIPSVPKAGISTIGRIGRSIFGSFAHKARGKDDEVFAHDGATVGFVQEEAGKDGEDYHPELFTAMKSFTAVATAPLTRLEHFLHPYVTFLILPIFAFANAGVDVRGMGFEGLLQPISLGIIVGLVLGKTIGIFFTSLLSVKLGLADFPKSVSKPMLAGIAVLGGMGFTMSLFVANLAFPGETHQAMLDTSKIGVLSASTIAGILGWGILRMVTPKPTEA